MNRTRTHSQRRRQDAYYPDTMSRQARRLTEMRQVWAYWRDRTGPATGYALARADMLSIADRACHELAAGLIAQGLTA